METLLLTGAELAFLLSSADATKRTQAMTRLRLSEAPDAQLKDGLASLAVRGLVRGTGADLTIAAPVAAVMHGLTEPAAWVEVTALTQDAVDAAQLYVHDRGVFLLTPRAYGTYAIQGIRAGVSPADVLVSLAQTHLGQQRPAMVACHGEPAQSEGSVMVASLADGGWLVVEDGTGARRPSATLDGALRDFAAALAAQSPAIVASQR